ncbi:hypothetical protein SKAU_G00154380 [Synaphobranchus kaupii]|uniref:Uncharacterized protein n=1 Tax=Synaphobranchus kaupii TaxID=118154 RepID=A0A9Q1FH90_SYNKA|nr:hypothetical protein SKAU_G00154380 [Synaphobranchus kaupii]
MQVTHHSPNSTPTIDSETPPGSAGPLQVPGFHRGLAVIQSVSPCCRLGVVFPFVSLCFTTLLSAYPISPFCMHSTLSALLITLAYIRTRHLIDTN